MLKKIFVYLLCLSQVWAKPSIFDIQKLPQGFSPALEAVVLLESGLLEEFRFYGAYNPRGLDGNSRDWIHPAIEAAIKKYKGDLDPIVKEFEASSVLDAYKRILERIGAYDSQIYAKNQEFYNIPATDPEKKEKQDRLNNETRLIQSQQRELNTTKTTLRKVFDDIALDPMAAWMQMLFLSPNFLQLAPNSRNRDPIGELLCDPKSRAANAIIRQIQNFSERTKETDFKETFRSTYLEFMKQTENREFKLIKGRLSRKQKEDFIEIADKVSTVLFSALTQQTMPRLAQKQARIQKLETLLFKYQEDLKKAKKPSKKAWLSTLIKEIEGKLKKERRHLKNLTPTPQKETLPTHAEGEQVYPENLALTLFLAFLWARADTVDQLQNIDMFRTQTQEFNEEAPWTEEFFNLLISDEEMLKKHFDIGVNPKFCIAFKLFQNQQASEVPKLFGYRGDTQIQNGPIIYDCGENSLRQFLWLAARNGRRINKEIFTNLESNLTAPKTCVPYQKMLKYFDVHGSLDDAEKKEAHDDWATLLSRLNSDCPKDRQITYKSEDLFEIVGGFISMMNVISQFFPNPVLSLGWPKDEEEALQLGQKKLDELCRLFTRTDFRLRWKGNPNEYRPTLSSLHVTQVIFNINGTNAFTWRFGSGHYEIESHLELSVRGLLRAYRLPTYYPASAVLLYFFNDQENASKFGIPLVNLFSKKNRSVGGIIEFLKTIPPLSTRNYDAFLARLILKTINFDDPEPCKKFAQLMADKMDNPFYSTYLMGFLSQVQSFHLSTPYVEKLLTSQDLCPHEKFLMGFLDFPGINLHDKQNLHSIFRVTSSKKYPAFVTRLANLIPYNDDDFCSALESLYSGYGDLDTLTALIETIRRNGMALNRSTKRNKTLISLADNKLIPPERKLTLFNLSLAICDMNAEFENGNLFQYLATPLHPDLIDFLISHGVDPNSRSTDKKRQTLLHIAAEKEQNKAYFAHVLGRTKDSVHYHDCNGLTALMRSVAAGNLVTAEHFLENRFNPNRENEEGKTAVHCLADFKGDVETLERMTQLLLRFGAVMDHEMFDGTTLAHLCVRGDDPEKVLYLLGLGVPVNARNSKGSLPLMETKNPRVIEKLLSLGASPNVVNSLGVSFLHSLIVNQIYSPSLFKKLNTLHLRMVNVFDSSGLAPIHLAAKLKENQELWIDFLLRAGANLFALDPQGHSFLHYLVMNEGCSENLFKKLKEIRPRLVKILDYEGEALINFAAEENKTPIWIDFLIDLIDNPEITNGAINKALLLTLSREKNALSLALFSHGAKLSPPIPKDILKTVFISSCPELWSQLVNQGTNVNFLLSHNRYSSSSSEEEYTPLSYWLKKNDSLEEVGALLHLGADPNFVIKESTNPDRNPETVFSQFATPYSDAHYSPGYLEKVKLLVKFKANVNHNSGYHSLLGICLERKFYEEAKILIDGGAKLNSKTEIFGTPLCEACYKIHQNQKTIEFLLNNGADPLVEPEGIYFTKKTGKQKSRKYPPAFFHLKEKDKDRHLQILDLFIAHGMDINHRDSEGKTPLIYHICYLSPDLLKGYLDRGADASKAPKELLTPETWTIEAYELEKMDVEKFRDHVKKASRFSKFWGKMNVLEEHFKNNPQLGKWQELLLENDDNESLIDKFLNFEMTSLRFTFVLEEDAAKFHERFGELFQQYETVSINHMIKVIEYLLNHGAKSQGTKCLRLYLMDEQFAVSPLEKNFYSKVREALRKMLTNRGLSVEG